MSNIRKDYGPQGACGPKTAWALESITALMFAMIRRPKRGRK